MRILITGGAGFLGSHLVDSLLADGNNVIVFDNLVTGRVENIAHHLVNDRFRFVQQDVTDYLDVPGHLDAVVHFASPASPIDYLQLPIQTLKVGSLGTHKALGLAKEKKARFLLASTSEVYGDPQVHPQTEDYWGHVNPVGPRGVYDEAKRFGEAITMAYHRYHGVDTRIVRIFNTYGGRMRINDGRVVSNFIVQAIRGEPLTVYGDGNQTRSFCYVSDLVRGIIRLLLLDSVGTGEETEDRSTEAVRSESKNLHYPVNLGNPSEYTVVELAKTIIQLTQSGSVVEARALPVDDPRVRKPDITRARQLLEWSPLVGLEEGLRNTIIYFRSVLGEQVAGG